MNLAIQRRRKGKGKEKGWRVCGQRDWIAALRLGHWGLRLEQLDDAIEAAQQAVADGLVGAQAGVDFLEKERARLMLLLDKDSTGLAARDAARGLAALLREAAMQPAAAHGAKFKGRKAGSVSKVRCWIQKFIKQFPQENAAAAWAAISKNSPPGVEVFASGPRDRWHITTKGARSTGYPRFANIVSEEKKLL